MPIIIKEITDEDRWEGLFNQSENPSFLQSWAWGKVQENLGYQTLRLGFYQKNSVELIVQILKIRAKRGSFLFIPHGPSIVNQGIKKKKIRIYFKHLLKYLIKLSRDEKYDFIRVAPILEKNEENKMLLANLRFRTAPIYMHAETTWVLDLKNNQQFYIDDEQLLKNMRKTTRYLVRKGLRESLIIQKRTDKNAIDDFWKIYEETANREHFTPFSKKYLQFEFEEFNKEGNALFLFAYQGNENNNKNKNIDYLSSALIIFTKNSAFYHQGASYHSKLPVSYLLQWEGIKEAKKRGCKFYNFWGIYDQESRRTPLGWKGLSLFKKGFGGRQISYLPTQDYIVSPLKYLATFLYEKYIAWKRKLG